MATISNSFRFTGTFASLKEGLKGIVSQKNPKWSGKELTFLVKTETGSQYVRLFGGVTEGKPLMTFSKDKDDKNKAIKLEIPYSKRLDEDVIKMVADFRKYKVFDKEFISELDAIDYIQKNLVDFENVKVTVYGKVKFDTYKGKITQKYYLQSIDKANANDDEEFKGNMALFITSDAISEDYRKNKGINYDLIKKDRKIPINFYVEQYNEDKATQKEVPNLYIPVTAFITVKDTFDFDNPEHFKRLKFLVETLVVKKGIWEIGMEVRYFRGQEKEEITMDDLTNFEKSQIESNSKTFEEIVQGKQGYGQAKEELQLIRYHAKYPNGLIETALTDDMLGELQVEETKPTQEEKVNVVVDEEDLF